LHIATGAAQSPTSAVAYTGRLYVYSLLCCQRTFATGFSGGHGSTAPTTLPRGAEAMKAIPLCSAGVAAVRGHRPGGGHLRLLGHAQPDDQPGSLVSAAAERLLCCPCRTHALSCSYLHLSICTSGCSTPLGRPASSAVYAGRSTAWTGRSTELTPLHGGPKDINSAQAQAELGPCNLNTKPTRTLFEPLCSVRKDRRMDYDDPESEAMKKQSNSYGTAGLLRNFGHVRFTARARPHISQVLASQLSCHTGHSQ